ncbi:MAG: class I SAM-dependent methyltransferase [Candidatus Sumerlaeota bacterium]|nr:class I SAM-dependent methyltransferase [Candidatus Sumerlaeota bacterium]
MNPFSSLLSNPNFYYYARQVLTLGMPFKDWIPLYGFADSGERIADLGCGPADILRYTDAHHKPAYYLGIDCSDAYLDSARRRAAATELNAEFLKMDLSLLTHDERVRRSLADTLCGHSITTVLLLGVLHHIPNEAARATLDLVWSAKPVRRIVTSDVIRIPGHRVNNFFCSLDRGEHIRDEKGYDTVFAQTRWQKLTKSWSSPGLSFIKYIHYCCDK